MPSAFAEASADKPGRSVHVYAVVSPGTSANMFRSSSGERLRLVRRGAVAAVVSDRPRPSTPSPAKLRRYDRTMRELAARFHAIIPVRFGTSMAEDELMVTLSARRAAFARALAGVRRRVQMTVRVVPGQGRSTRRDAGRSFRSASDAVPITGRDYLKARARDAAAARVVPGFEPVRQAVAGWVRDERVEHRAGVSSVYHLIPRSSAEAYRRALQASAGAAGLPVIVSGPWPPYAFGASE